MGLGALSWCPCVAQRVHACARGTLTRVRPPPLLQGDCLWFAVFSSQPAHPRLFVRIFNDATVQIVAKTIRSEQHLLHPVVRAWQVPRGQFFYSCTLLLILCWHAVLLALPPPGKSNSQI